MESYSDAGDWTRRTKPEEINGFVSVAIVADSDYNKKCNSNDTELRFSMNIVVDGYNICYKTTGTGDKDSRDLTGLGRIWECMIL